jgi:PAS domain S-box-containing protein
MKSRKKKLPAKSDTPAARTSARKRRAIPSPAANPLEGYSATELGAALERYAELFDLAPVAYVSFSRSGRIEEANLAASQLVGRGRNIMLGSPFSAYIHPPDISLFLNHLSQCRSGKSTVESELRLRTAEGKIIEVLLSSSANPPLVRGGAQLFQTAIVDLTSRKIAERQQNAVHRFVQRWHEAESLDDIYEAALDAIAQAVECERATILLFDQKGIMRCVAARGVSEAYRKAVDGHSPWNPRTKNPPPMWLEDIRRSDLPARTKKVIVAEKIVSCTYIPLLREGRLIGKFTLCWDQPHQFDKGDQTAIATIAGQLALAITRFGSLGELRESEERLRLLVEGAREYAMFLLDVSNTITYWNKGAERVFGWKAREVLGKSGNLIFTPADRARREVEKEMERSLRTGAAADSRWHLRKDGSRIWVEGAMHRLDDRDGNVRGFAKVARDATLDRHAAETLRQAHAELERRVRERTKELSSANQLLQEEAKRRRNLEAEILLISEREKRRFGQDLHDSLCQELAATAFLLQSKAQALEKTNPRAAALLAESAQQVNGNVSLARNLARGLHPVEVSSVGLTEALRDLAFRRSDSHTLCRFECPRQVRIADEAVALNLYRIAQEAVTNAVKNGRATRVVIGLERTRRDLVLSVRDNGAGFAPGKAKSGMGLDIMNYRAHILGAQLSIKSQPGHGTTVTCILRGE